MDCSRLALWAGLRLIPGLTLTGRGLKIQASDNVAMLRALARDPLVIHEIRVDTIYGLVDLMDAALDSAPFLEAPLLIMYGAKDEIVPKTPIRRFVGRLSAQCRGSRQVSLMRGWLSHAVGRPRRTHCDRRVANWVLNPAAPLPSGADRGATEAVLHRGDQLSLDAH